MALVLNHHLRAPTKFQPRFSKKIGGLHTDMVAVVPLDGIDLASVLVSVGAAQIAPGVVNKASGPARYSDDAGLAPQPVYPGNAPRFRTNGV